MAFSSLFWLSLGCVATDDDDDDDDVGLSLVGSVSWRLAGLALLSSFKPRFLCRGIAAGGGIDPGDV